MKIPVWKEITKKEYEKEIKQETIWDFFPSKYRRETVYVHNALFDEIWYPERKIIGYKYYKLIGYENIIIAASWFIDKLMKNKII